MTDLAAVAKENLTKHFATHVQLHSGRVFLALMPVFGVKSKELLVVYEGGGSMVYAGDRPLNKFRMIQSGFPGSVAELVSDLVNAIVRADTVKHIEGENHE